MIPEGRYFSAFSCEELAEKSREAMAVSPTLGIIFSSVHLGIPEVASSASSLGIPIFGSSTAGEILGTGGEEPVQERTAACCFIPLDPTLFAVSVMERGDDSSFELGARIGRWGRERFEEPAFVIAVAGLKNDGEAIVRGILSVSPAGTPLYGGLAGDDGRMEETFVFSSAGCTSDGAVVMVLDRSRVDLSGIVTSGWTGVGMAMTVTSSEGNVLHTLNNRPATKVLQEYLNAGEDDLVETAIMFPLLVQRPDGTVVLRTCLSADFSRGSMIFAGSIPRGAQVRFSSSFGYETIEKSIRDITSFHATRPDADLVIAFSCMARHWAAGTMVGDEIAAALRLWKKPLVGFFTYGEIGQGHTGQCDFHNESLCLVLLTVNPPTP